MPVCVWWCHSWFLAVTQLAGNKHSKHVQETGLVTVCGCDVANLQIEAMSATESTADQPYQCLLYSSVDTDCCAVAFALAYMYACAPVLLISRFIDRMQCIHAVDYHHLCSCLQCKQSQTPSCCRAAYFLYTELLLP